MGARLKLSMITESFQQSNISSCYENICTCLWIFQYPAFSNFNLRVFEGVGLFSKNYFRTFLRQAFIQLLAFRKDLTFTSYRLCLVILSYLPSIITQWVTRMKQKRFYPEWHNSASVSMWNIFLSLLTSVNCLTLASTWAYKHSV